MKKKRFRRHDEVTFLSLNECPRGMYRYGGEDHGGHTGKIHGYEEYIEEAGCWGIKVRCKSKDTFYSMLESEFVEYTRETEKAELNNYSIW